MKFNIVFFLIGFLSLSLQAQPDRWQQRVQYVMDIDFDVKTHRFTGVQKLKYTNNSKDVLDRVFYHLYFNAFQPGSMMDVRSQSISDPDGRVKSRISRLGPDEIGYQKVEKLTQDGQDTEFEVVGTILEVNLSKPIEPGETTLLEMEFNAQVPVQIRRSGRDNGEGISYSMCQWYPKLAEYDYQGWHANPYIGREFYGVWGDFEVNITIDKDYIIGGTGYLQNAEEIGYGYVDANTTVNQNIVDGKLTWNIKAPNVHDFMWGADPDYTHDTYKRDDGMVMHFYYQKNAKTEENWGKLPAIMDEAFSYINQHFGQYPYEQYSFVQGGDGGMEYPMATFITGHRSLGSLVGVSVHELMHSWYQMVLGTNESLHAWMDEGFTSYATSRVMNHLRKLELIPGNAVDNPHFGTYMGFGQWLKTGQEEPLSMHADHFERNRAYGVAAYTKGNIFLNQLEYVIGKEAFDQGLLEYYNTWKFKHPNPNDCIRIFEKVSGLELDWYKEYFVFTTHSADYGVQSVSGLDGKINITLGKIGRMPMPVDVAVNKTDGTVQHYTIPLQIMRGAKVDSRLGSEVKVLDDWRWVDSEYAFDISGNIDDIESVEIDPSMRLMDADRSNNKYTKN